MKLHYNMVYLFIIGIETMGIQTKSRLASLSFIHSILRIFTKISLLFFSDYLFLFFSCAKFKRERLTAPRYHSHIFIHYRVETFFLLFFLFYITVFVFITFHILIMYVYHPSFVILHFR